MLAGQDHIYSPPSRTILQCIVMVYCNTARVIILQFNNSQSSVPVSNQKYLRNGKTYEAEINQFVSRWFKRVYEYILTNKSSRVRKVGCFINTESNFYFMKFGTHRMVICLNKACFFFSINYSLYREIYSIRLK